ncbi:myosin-binding protein 7-like [Primulina tabacum]|uniref:myosin-binding protein 7-like n=1 Tax=Primulina tabacum TaxID=48773 RepID=UPI003F59606C
MESEDSHQASFKCCDCGCSCSVMNLAGEYTRSVKRKIEEFEEESVFTIPGFVVPQNARIGIDNECMALRETVSNQQQTIQDLISELDEERNASSSATSEAMSMILKLQREKADIQMEARQFKRFAEEKMAHDQEELLTLDDLLYKREQVIQSLTCEVQVCKHRMTSYGITDVGTYEDEGMSRNTSMTENFEGQFEFPPYEIFYPPLKCKLNESQVYPDGDDETVDVEKYAFGETPGSKDQLKDLEYRIGQLENSSRTIQPDGEYIEEIDVLEKVVNDHSPREPGNIREFSTDCSNLMSKDMGLDSSPDSPNSGSSFKKMGFLHVEENLNSGKVDNASEVGDDMSDRVYTIDSIHQASLEGVIDHRTASGICGNDLSVMSKESPNHSEGRDLEIQKLYARLHALEADRESMRQAIVTIGSKNAQLVLLKEIAQNLCKEMSPAGRMTVRKQLVNRTFSFLSIFKWILSFILWRRKTHRFKYSLGLSANNAGLLMLLDRSPRVGQWRSISST